MKASKLIILPILFTLLLTGCGTFTSNNEKNNADSSVQTASNDLNKPSSEASSTPSEEKHIHNNYRPKSFNDQIIDFFKKQIQFANQEDIEGYMSTIYDDSHLAEGEFLFLASELQKQFQKYDAKYELLDVSDIVFINKEEATAIYTYATTFIEQGQEFTSTMTASIELKIQNQVWKMKSIEVLKIIYTDENGMIFEPNTVDAMKLMMYKLSVPSLDENNGNYPGQNLSEVSNRFISRNLDLFPAITNDTIQEVITLADDSIEFRELSKNISKFNGNLISGEGYIYDIYEYDSGTELGMVTEIFVATDDTKYYEGYQIFILGTTDAYTDDYVRFYGLPVIMSGYENSTGGYTTVALLIGSYVEVNE